MSVPLPRRFDFAWWVYLTFPPPAGFTVCDSTEVGPVIAYDGRGNVLRFQQAGPIHWVQIASAPAKEASAP